jgi:hypothetical protein
MVVRRRCSRIAPALLSAAVALGPVYAAARPGPLQLVDDRGKAIAGELEVCFQIGTRSDCVSGRGTPVEVPPEFVSVRVEGPDHGPISVPWQNLKKNSNGDFLLAVPRKALLQISASPEERLNVSLYPQDDSTFRTPSFRSEVRGGSSLKVPAGDHLLSLTASGRAPDLHLLSAKPGGNERLVYRPRPGWSLVVRCRAEKESAPVQGAQIDLDAMEGFSAGGHAERQISGKSGLALFSGLSHLLASARIEQSRFVPHREEGISASPGTFAFREALLEEGGRLRATVTAEGKPLAGADCRVLEYDPNPRGPAPEPKVLFQGMTDKAGICRSGRIAPGPYTLRLAMAGNRSFLDRSVVLTNGEETEVAVPMVSIRVHGTVLRGTEAAPSYGVTFSDENEIKPNATRRDAQAEATTNEEGEYEALLWSPGDYDAGVRTPEGTPATHKRLRLENTEERVDFFLEDHDVSGVVLDDRDRPVADATVVLSWNQRSHRLSRTGKKGSFSFPLAEDGTGTVRTLKPGYFEPPLIEVEAHPGAYPPPLVVRLKRTGLLAGKLLNAAGPAAGASLLSYRLEPGGTATPLGIAVVNGEGRFELAAADGVPTRVFGTGAGCPLTSFDLVPSAEEVVLHCAEQPASLELHFADPQGKPLPGKSVMAQKDGVVIPEEVLTTHLSGLRLLAATDGGGRLLLVGLAPGNYDLYLAEATNPSLIASGLPNGFLTASSLAPLTTTELAFTLEAVP